MRRITGICIIAVLLFAIFPVHSHAVDKIILVGTADIKESNYGKLLFLIFSEVFRRLGYELQYDGYPSARASALSDAGKVDGEICRVFEYQLTHPEMIRVDEPHSSSKFIAFAIKPGITLRGWEDLEDTTYNVEYRRGSNLPETELPRFVAAEHLSNVSTVEQGIKKLLAGRTDIYVDGEITTIEAMGKMDADEFDTSTIYQAGIMQKIDLFLYLHKKKADLVSPVEKILTDLKQEGLIEEYRNMAFTQP